jgi:hypothetical protein
LYLSKVLFGVNSVTSGDPSNPSRGILENAYNNFTEDFKTAIMESWHAIGKSIHDGLVTFGESVLKGLVFLLEPLVNFGCKSVILYCIIIYYCTDGQDKTTIKLGLKALLIFIIFEYLRGTIL